MRPRRLRTPDAELGSLLRAAAANLVGCAGRLRELIASYPENQGLVDEIVADEHAGDRITHDFLHRLNALPPRRRPFDIVEGLALATALDDIVDYAEQTAESLRLYAVEAPMAQAEQLADVLVRASQQVAEAVGALADGHDYREQLAEIHRLENEGDRLVRDAVAALFVGHVDPMVVIRWKDIFESLEQAIDACEHVGHRLQGIAMRRDSGR